MWPIAGKDLGPLTAIEVGKLLQGELGTKIELGVRRLYRCLALLLKRCLGFW